MTCVLGFGGPRSRPCSRAPPLRQTRVKVVAVDTAVQAARRVSRAAEVQLAGGGGTDIGAGIEAAASLRPGSGS